MRTLLHTIVIVLLIGFSSTETKTKSTCDLNHKDGSNELLVNMFHNLNSGNIDQSICSPESQTNSSQHWVTNETVNEIKRNTC